MTGGESMATTAEGSEALSTGASDYRFEHLRLGIVLRDMYYAKTDPAPGDRIVDFDLPTLDGGRFRSADLAETAPVLLVFGSYTCPVTDSAAPGLRELHAQFGKRVRFVMVNVREAHPGARVPQPKSFEKKKAHAESLRRVHDFQFEVAVDDIDGTLHRAMSPKPNSAYLLASDGSIIFRAHWANATRALSSALDDVAAGRPPRHTESHAPTHPIWPTARYVGAVLDRAGAGAWRDMWLAAPPMAAAGWLLRRPSPGSR
jgi:thiol-disulfide isomerase/thioredoxin